MEKNVPLSDILQRMVELSKSKEKEGESDVGGKPIVFSLFFLVDCLLARVCHF